SGEEPLHLRGHPLAGDMSGEARVLADRREGCGLDVEPEDRRQPDGADHAQGILAESRSRVTDRPERVPVQVGEPTERVDQLARARARFTAPRDGVHGEVAAREVEADVVAELDPMWPTEVGVFVIRAEGRDLVDRAALADR